MATIASPIDVGTAASITMRTAWLTRRGYSGVIGDPWAAKRGKYDVTTAVVMKIGIPTQR